MQDDVPERRTGDRREGQQPFDGPERRVGDRRAGMRPGPPRVALIAAAVAIIAGAAVVFGFFRG